MAELPLIILPERRNAVRSRRPPFVPKKLRVPTRSAQSQRLTPKFQAVKRALEQSTLAIQSSIGGQAPEEVVVLEVIGGVNDFYRVVGRTPGLEWLCEWDEDDVGPEDGFALEENPTSRIDARLYLVMTSQSGIEEILRLWRLYQSSPNSLTAAGLTPWLRIFEHLKDVRLWDTKDRLASTGVEEYWQDFLKADGLPAELRFEAELWYRESSSDIAARAFTELVAQEGGRVISQTVIKDIAYHGVLLQMPRTGVEALTRSTSGARLLRSREVRYFRPIGQSVVLRQELTAVATTFPPAPLPTGEPVVALFDGLPLENHEALAGRLVVDDPDGFSDGYQAAFRQHGTAMASLITRGELDANEPPTARPVYVRPIMRPDPLDWQTPPREGMPADTLPLDLLHRAVVRLFEGGNDTPGVAPSVRIINLSIGDPDCLFDREVSPWARLIDFLSIKYNVLFIISAGNHPLDIDLGVPRAVARAMAPEDLRRAVMTAISRDIHNRRLLSPAEAVNALTVGALHDDGSPSANLGRRKDILPADGLPSPINALGHGFRRSIKPDILMPGGRQLYEEKVGVYADAVYSVSMGGAAPGHKVAWPSGNSGELSGTRYVRGTSNAAALASRTAADVHDRLVSLSAEEGGKAIPSSMMPVLVKTLMVHGARWGESGDVLESYLRNSTNSRQFKAYASRFLGHGASIRARVLSCTEQRATLIGYGEISEEEAHSFEIPLPTCLSGPRVYRRLTVTLAWLTPINTKHRYYRRAALWFEPPKDPLGIERAECDWQAVQRGTVQHEILEAEKATAFAEGSSIAIQVNCRSYAGSLNGLVRYGLAVSLEVAEEAGLPVYQQVATAIRTRGRVADRVPLR